MWYAPEDLAFRQGMFFSAASAAGGFSGLLAYAINKMNGLGGYSGWRWIFIVEGAATVIVAFIAFFLIHDFPDTAKFLDAEEKAWAIERVKYSVQGRSGETGKVQEEAEAFKWKYVKAGLTDWQIWIAVIVCYPNLSVTPLTITGYMGLFMRSLRYQFLPADNRQSARLYSQRCQSPHDSDVRRGSNCNCSGCLAI